MAFTAAVIGEPVIALKWEIARRVDPATWKGVADVWTQEAAPNDNVYSKAFTEGVPSNVEEDGISYDLGASVAAVQATPGSYYWAANVLYVQTLLSVIPTNNCILLAYFYDRYATHSPVVLEGKYYEPRLSLDSIPEITVATSSYQAGGTQQSFGSIKLNNGDGWFDRKLSDYIYEAKLIQLLAAMLLPTATLESLVFSDFSVVWEGWSGDIDWSDSVVTVNTEDPRLMLLR